MLAPLPPREAMVLPDRDRLHAALDAAFEEALHPLKNPDGPLGVLFSAGVDSSLLAWELRHRPEVVLCTMGCEGSPDLRAGRIGAERLGLPWEGITVDVELVHRTEDRFPGELAGLPSVSRTVLLSLAIAIDRASPARLVCGQGVDELFLGYAHYRGLSEADAERRSREDLARLRGTDWPRTQAIAKRLGKQARAPYLALPFEAAATRIPLALRLPADRPKQFFREWAVGRGLPAELAERPKKALQYGSGVDALVRGLRRAGR